MSKIWGYARCSTNEDKQDINRQIRELKAAGAEKVIFEYEHGDAKVKKNLQLLLDSAEAGDTIITLEVSRLSRSTQQLCQIIDVICCLRFFGFVSRIVFCLKSISEMRMESSVLARTPVARKVFMTAQTRHSAQLSDEGRLNSFRNSSSV